MTTCPKCGWEIGEAKRCDRCGFRVDLWTAPAPANHRPATSTPHAQKMTWREAFRAAIASLIPKPLRALGRNMASHIPIRWRPWVVALLVILSFPYLTLSILRSIESFVELDYTMLKDDGGKAIHILLKDNVPEERTRAVAESAARTWMHVTSGQGSRKFYFAHYFWVDVYRRDSAGDPRPHARLRWPTHYASAENRGPEFFLIAGAKHEFDKRPSRSVLTSLACPKDPRVSECFLDEFKEYVELTLPPAVPDGEAVRFSEEIARQVGNLAPSEKFAVIVYRDARVESLLGEARYDPQTQSVSFKRFH